MKRNYDTGILTDIDFFIGTEIEQTPAHGLNTLFVVGCHTDKIIESKLKKFKDIKHIYFGANKSIKNSKNALVCYFEMVRVFLKKEYLCTLDIPIHYIELLHESGLCEYHNFIPMLSVELPYTNLFNYNTCIKIDDKDFKASNPGVWVHRLHDLMDTDKFTDWAKYSGDKILK